LGSSLLIGSGLLYAAGGNKLWLLKDADPEGYRAARRRHQPHIDLRCAKFHLRIGRSRIHRFDVFAEVTNCSLEMAALNRELRNWEKTYNTVRPHRSIGYLTPLQFLQQWHSQRKV
jgi:transposase InsO family protein